MGICQGLEVVSVILGGDDLSTLDEIVIYGENRPIDWGVDPQDSQMFG